MPVLLIAISGRFEPCGWILTHLPEVEFAQIGLLQDLGKIVQRWARNRVASLMRRPNSRSTRVNMRARSSEWPPNSKKLSAGSTESMPSMVFHSSARRRSTSPLG